MTIKVKHLGIITRFNGVNIAQKRKYINISNKTYIDKILEDKTWEILPSHHSHLPMNDDSAYTEMIEDVTPLSEQDLIQTEKDDGFSYRQYIGELVYAMVACRPDISFPLINLIQYSTSPAL